MFQPKYTMNGLAVKDRMSANGSLRSRVLRVILRSQLGHIQSSLFHVVCNSSAHPFEAGRKLPNGWTELQSFSLAKNIIAAANSQTFFGESLSAIPQFLQAALDYPEYLFKTAELLRLMPSVVAPVVASTTYSHAAILRVKGTSGVSDACCRATFEAEPIRSPFPWT